MAVIDLTARRLQRLEKQQQETNTRLERMEGTMGRVAEILEAHSRHFERMEDALLGISERVDRLTSAIARGRTADLARLDDHDRRLHALEASRPKPRSRRRR
jgi:hypothetical protein